MTTITIIGSGNMATAIGTRAAKHGHTVELMSRNTTKAQALRRPDRQRSHRRHVRLDAGGRHRHPGGPARRRG